MVEIVDALEAAGDADALRRAYALVLADVHPDDAAEVSAIREVYHRRRRELGLIMPQADASVAEDAASEPAAEEQESRPSRWTWVAVVAVLYLALRLLLRLVESDG